MQYIFIFLVGYAMYGAIELTFNAIARAVGWYDNILDWKGTYGWKKKSKATLEARTSLWVCIIGGTIELGSYLLFLAPFFHEYYSIPVYAIIIGVTITLKELVFGILFNVVLKWNLWTYQDEPLNYKGQISILRSVAWTALGVLMWFLNRWLYLRLS